MSDLLERLRDMEAGKHDDLDIAAEAINEIIDLNWRVVEIEKERDELRAQNAELRAQIAAHERECAGVLVKVEERLPVAFRSVQTYHGEGRVCHSNCVDRHGAWYVPEASHWLDARMPGEE